MKKPTMLILWDVDHTLIENGGVSKETYALAYELLTGVEPVHRPQTDGRTDPTIMRELFASNGLAFTPEHDERLFAALVEAMRRKTPELAKRGHALPGAEAALSGLSEDPSVVQTVLTGNIVENARAKLAPFGLDKYLDFEVGGYGSDDIVRSRLVAIARHRASSKYSISFDRDSTVLVGDTLRDVDAGLQGGARVIAVATGIDSETTLREAGAHEVLPDLVDTAQFLGALARLGLGRSAGA
jgi:phosphoglycolate phosphatase